MSELAPKSREIDGKGRTVRELLANRKYSIDYYQREYKWQRKQLSELLDDLADKFLENYDPLHERSQVAEYSRYFLGSIIVSDKDGERFIIDGQQRLTTLTLLLIFIRHQLDDPEQQGEVSQLIFSTSYGKKSFNLDVPDRTPCMEALYNGTPLVAPEHDESVTNVLARYADLDDIFPADLRGEALPFFTDWLMQNVQLVEITAYSDRDAYTIFETMNDRGLSLTPVDMLKGYLLANITEEEGRTRATKLWKERITALGEIGKDEDADGIKAWLRSQWANSIRERKKGATPLDFDLIGTEFHRWIRDEKERLGLNKSGDFLSFIERDFAFFTRWYERLRQAATSMTPGLEPVYHNAANNFTLQYQVLLAPVEVGDADDTARRKIAVVATYLDIMINRRIWNGRAIDYSSMQYAMFIVTRDIRGKTVDELVDILTKRLDETEDFTANEAMRLHGMNGPAVHRILARMTDYLEVGSGMPSRFSDYMRRGGKDAYEIEHIWANHPERHEDEFSHPTDFAEYRNRIGGLLLLPKSFNASFGDLRYEEKLQHYDSQNLLARSLGANAYQRNPGFLSLIERTGLPFKAMEHFKKAELESRQTLYTELAGLVWSPDRIAVTAEG